MTTTIKVKLISTDKHKVVDQNVIETIELRDGDMCFSVCYTGQDWNDDLEMFGNERLFDYECNILKRAISYIESCWSEDDQVYKVIVVHNGLQTEFPAPTKKTANEIKETILNWINN